MVMAGYNNPGDELRAIVQRKQYEVKKLLELHSESNDPLQMRMSYAVSQSSYTVRNAIRRNKDPDDDHQMLVIADLKRRSPTASNLSPYVSDFSSAADFAVKAYESGAGLIMVNTDGPAYGGSLEDLESVVVGLGAEPDLSIVYIIHIHVPLPFLSRALHSPSFFFYPRFFHQNISRDIHPIRLPFHSCVGSTPSSAMAGP
ncbi:unnamed protein product [Choristocarpus tenellus]